MRRSGGTGIDSSQSPLTRRIVVASLAVAVVGVAVFGSVIAAVGEWVEGRQLETVAGWAIPGLILAVLATLAAMRTLFMGEGRWSALALGPLVAVSLVLLLLLNPSAAPPVP